MVVSSNALYHSAWVWGNWQAASRHLRRATARSLRRSRTPPLSPNETHHAGRGVGEAAWGWGWGFGGGEG